MWGGEIIFHFFYIRTNFIRTASLKMDQKLRTNWGSKSSPTKKIEYLAKINIKNKNNLRTFEPLCASIIKNIEPRTKISDSYKKSV